MQIHEVTLDLLKETQLIPDEIIVRVGEGGSQTIKATLVSAGEPYTVQEGWVPALCLLTAPGNTKIQQATADGNVVTITMADEMLTDEGTCRLAYFRITGPDGEVQTTEGFKLRIMGTVVTRETVLSWDGQLAELLKEFEEQVERIKEQEALRVQNEQLRQGYEGQRQGNEATRMQQEAQRSGNERTREDNEGQRQADEAKRESQESARESAEASRKSVESDRVEAENARDAAEKQRDAAETERKANEDQRQTNEDTRKTQEAGRVDAEAARVKAEGERSTAEDQRAEAETKRASAENDRAEAETQRAAAETTRQDKEAERLAAEAERVANEAERKTSESSRVEAEAKRVESQAANDVAQAKNNADQERNNLLAQGWQFEDLTEEQVDPETRVPTMDPNEAKLGVMYFAPAASAQQNDEAVEWIVKPRGDDPSKYRWERVGGGEMVLPQSIGTDKIQQMHVEGESISGKGIMGEADLTFYDSLLKSDRTNDKATQSAKDAEQDEAIGAAQSAADKASGALDAFKTSQAEKDAAQDAATQKAQDAADKAAGDLAAFKTQQAEKDAAQDSATEKALTDAKQYADDQKEILDGQISDLQTAVDGAATKDDLDQFKTDMNKEMDELVDRVAEAVEPKLPDPRALNKLIEEATGIHDGAFTDSGDHDLGTWKSTAEAIQALQAAIDKAQGVSDGYGTTVFSQSELDAAEQALQQALETFKSASTQVTANLTEYEALKARAKAVDDSTTVSADGKDVTFGSKWVSSSARSAIDLALQTAETAVKNAKRQTEIDTACDTLETAVTAYENAVKTAAADTAALDAAIKAAQEARAGVVVSADGSELEPGSSYVTEQQTLDDMDAAIAAAQTAKTDSTTQKQLDDATTALKAATETFNGKLQQNLKIPQSSAELDAMSWEEIAQLSAAAAKDPSQFAAFVAKGAKFEKTITMSGISGVTTVKARIIGVGQDVDESGNKLGLTFQLRDGLAYNQPVNMRMNASQTTSGGWEKSEMRTTNLPKIEAALPSDLKALLKTMKKKTNMASSGSTITETSDKLALLSCVEVFGPTQSNYGSNSSGFQTWYPNEGEWYDWYKNNNTDADRIINQASGSALGWWLRSVRSSTSVAVVSYTGDFYWRNANASYLPCACFCV